MVTKNKFLKRFLAIYSITAVACVSASMHLENVLAKELPNISRSSNVELYRDPLVLKTVVDTETEDTVSNYVNLLPEPKKYIEYELDDGVIVKVDTETAKELDKRKEQKRQEEEERERNTVIPVNKTEVSDISITKYTDLSVNKTITTDDMNSIIEYWNSKCGGTPFLGRGDVFIEASKRTGLDPVYIFAHAALESGWGKSDLAIYKANYFGIGAYDSDPYGHGYSMGDGLHDGIIEGAEWINTNYYQQGQTSLYDMIYGQKQYASAADSWIDDIASIMNTSYNVIEYDII